MAELIKIYPENPNPKAIEKVRRVLKDGGLVIYPTDTVYGLGCDITNTKALEKKKEVEARLEEQYALLKQARQALEEVADKQSTEYSEALEKVTQLEQKVEELEGLKNAYTTLAASKDSFVHKHNLTIKVLTSLRSNLQTHRAKLKSDTDERLKYYDGYVVALKARTDQEFAAILEHLGVKTDEHIGQTLAAMHSASAKARQEMMDNIPVHEKVMQGVYSSYAEALVWTGQIFRQDLQLLLSLMSSDLKKNGGLPTACLCERARRGLPLRPSSGISWPWCELLSQARLKHVKSETKNFESFNKFQ